MYMYISIYLSTKDLDLNVYVYIQIHHLSISSVAGGVSRFSDACGLPCDIYIYLYVYISPLYLERRWWRGPLF